MNELRWILLGAGLLLIAGIYFWEVFKQKRYIRSRIENYPSFNHESVQDLSIKPREEDSDVSEAIADLNVFLNDSRQDTPGKEPLPGTAGRPEQDTHAEPAAEKPARQKIIVVYITAREGRVFNGRDIAQAAEAAGMNFGTMDIYHYNAANLPETNLFSLANIHEPGTFSRADPAAFSTDGLAMFLCLPQETPGAELFDRMLECARQIASKLDADLRNENHEIASGAELERLRATAAQYH